MNPFYRNHPSRKFMTKFPDVQTLIEKLYLTAIVDAYLRIRAIAGIATMKENDIRNKIVEDFKLNNPFLSGYLNNKLLFLAAENQANTATFQQRTDLELHSGNHQHNFVIECKKLISAEQRYVQGRTIKGGYQHDGLEKFIDLTYAKLDSEGAMLSFIVGGVPTAIVSTLNRKVQGFNPSPACAALSLQQCIGWSLSFKSSHICTNGKTFHLYHLFYDLT